MLWASTERAPKLLGIAMVTVTTDLAGVRGMAAGDAHLRLRPTRGHEEEEEACNAHLEGLGDAFEPSDNDGTAVNLSSPAG